MIDSELTDYEIQNIYHEFKQFLIENRVKVMETLKEGIAKCKPVDGKEFHDTMKNHFYASWRFVDSNNYVLRLPIRFHHSRLKWFRALELFYYFGKIRDAHRSAFLINMDRVIEMNRPKNYIYQFEESLMFERFRELKDYATRLWDSKKKSPIQIVKTILKEIRKVCLIAMLK